MRLLRYISIIALVFLPMHLNARIVPDTQAVACGKGHWMVGGVFSYGTGSSDALDIAMLSDVSTSSFSLKLCPDVCFMLKDDFGIGVRGTFRRSLSDLISAEAGVGDVSVGTSDYRTLTQSAGAALYLRKLIPFGQSGRFSMKADIGASYLFGQGKDIDAHSGNQVGAFTESTNLKLYVNPGFVAFVTDRLGLSLEVGMFAFGKQSTTQIENQVKQSSSSANRFSYAVDLSALSFGMHFYL